MAKQTAKAEKRLSDGYNVAPKDTAAISSKADAPSYSAVTAGKAHPPKGTRRDPAGKLTTTDPPVEVELRGVPVPSRPGITNLFTGSVSQSRVFNRLSLIINFILVAAMLDMTLSPIFFNQETDLAFTRVGGVGDTWANIVARVPPVTVAVSETDVDPLVNMTSSNPYQVVVGAKLLYRLTQPIGPWINGGEFDGTNETDYVSTLHLESLYPSTQYEYRLALPGPTSISFHPSFDHAQRFTTWSDPKLAASTGSHFKFASTSCMVTGWPWSLRFGKDRLRMDGVSYLASAIKQKSIEFVVFVGDFIYVDVPTYTGAHFETYARKYRQVYASESWKAVYEQVPTIHIYDDHEIYNDYSDGNETSPVFQAANKAFQLYNGDGNPAITKMGDQPNYRWSRNGDSAFFIWDLRRYRSSNYATDNATKTMLGAEQKQYFKDWLSTVNQTVTWKFVISSVPFNTLWDSGAASAADTWAAFVHERQELLDIMEFVPNIIVLSGDRHEFAAVSMRHSVLEFSTSPLHQFYLPIRTLSQKHGLGATGEDVLLKYLPDGNSKYTTFEVDTRAKNKPVVKVETFIDGELAWNVDVLGKPVHIPPVHIGSLAPTLSELLAFLRRKWF